MTNQFIVYLHYGLVLLLVISVVGTYFKVRKARKAGHKNSVIMLGRFNAAQEAPRWFVLIMNGIALLITLICSAFLLFAAYYFFFRL